MGFFNSLSQGVNKYVSNARVSINKGLMPAQTKKYVDDLNADLHEATDSINALHTCNSQKRGLLLNIMDKEQRNTVHNGVVEAGEYVVHTGNSLKTLLGISDVLDNFVKKDVHATQLDAKNALLELEKAQVELKKMKQYTINLKNNLSGSVAASAGAPGAAARLQKTYEDAERAIADIEKIIIDIKANMRKNNYTISGNVKTTWAATKAVIVDFEKVFASGPVYSPQAPADVQKEAMQIVQLTKQQLIQMSKLAESFAKENEALAHFGHPQGQANIVLMNNLSKQLYTEANKLK